MSWLCLQSWHAKAADKCVRLALVAMRPIENGSAKSGTRTTTSKIQLKIYEDNNEQTSSTMFHPGGDEGPSEK